MDKSRNQRQLLLHSVRVRGNRGVETRFHFQQLRVLADSLLPVLA
jgi:hypothetical protein